MSLVDLTAARRIPLIGRRDLLEEIDRRIRRGGTHLLYFEGDGGIGKTALLETVLQQARTKTDTGAIYARCVAREIVDLYHLDVHTPEGLIRRIVHVLGPQGLSQTAKIQSEIDRARSAGNADVAAERLASLQSTFMEEFSVLAEGGIVLALDTLEVLDYDRDEPEAEMSEDLPKLGSKEWLLNSFLVALRGHVVLLLAGRPCSLGERLEQLRRENPFVQLRHVSLAALGLDDTRDYLHIVAHAEEERGDADAAARLAEFGDERAEIVHLLTGGRPILLALVADMVAHGWLLPPPFGRNLEELQHQGTDTWWPEIEWALVMRIQESPTPVGDTMRALAWLRKGATPELLARVMGLALPDGTWDLDTARHYLAQVADLALVKVRPNEGRVFLHDEMYALLDRYVLRDCSPEERERVFELILDFYQNLADDLAGQIEQVAGLAPSLYTRLREAYVEELHYRLRYRPALGFAYYFWRAEEAQSGVDTELDMLLHAELFRTIGLLQSLGPLTQINMAELETDTAVRWGIRTLFFLNDPAGALAIFERIRERLAREADELGLAWVHLQLYRAVSRILRAEEDDWHEARGLLHEVERRADALLAGTPDPAAGRGLLAWLRAPRAPLEAQAQEGQRWRARILKALALNYEGYLDRQQGQYKEAVRHYQASAILQRRLGMAGLAAVLINLSYAMALIGECHPARLLTEEAERWARRQGQDYTLAVALNVRALVEAYDGHYKTALRFTDRALSIARGLRAPRVRGLIYLTRARARRHLLDPASAEVHDAPVLQDALKEANQAVNLLKNNPPDRVAALIERGCMHREIARQHYAQNDQVAAQRAARNSQRDLERTVALAGVMDLPDQQALAWINLGWLWYYAGQPDEAATALEQVARCVPAAYCFPAALQERHQEARLPFWSTLGEAEMLRANIALDQSRDLLSPEAKREQLKAAVRHVTLGLAYFEQVAAQYAELIHAEESLHRRILHERLSIGQLHKFAAQVAQEQGFSGPSRFQVFLERMFGPADLWA